MDNRTDIATSWETILARAADALLLAALLVGSGLRVILTLGSDFPWNDGGMFYVMVKDLLANRFVLPAYTSFNAAHIPFVYPPLPFYLGATLSALGIDLLQVQRWLPVVFSMLSIAVFYLLARATLKNKWEATLATAVFAVILPGFDRLLMGGGLTRAPGLLFALLALFALQRLYQDGKRSSILPAAACLALAALSHPVYAWFTAYSALLLFLFTPDKRRNLPPSAIAAGGALLLTAPWWITVLVNHGLSPLSAAMHSRTALSLGATLGQLLIFDLTREMFLDVLGALALLGLLWQLVNRQYLLTTWLAAIFLLERTTPVSLAAVPLALLAGIGAGQIVQLILTKVNPARRSAAGVLIVALGVLLYSALSGFLGFSPPAISSTARDAMQWAKTSTPPDSRFVVVTGARWWDDPASEWFPALSERIGAATVQGYEWLPAGALTRQIEAYDELQVCACSTDPDCLEGWARSHESDFSYVYLLKPENNAPSSPACMTLQDALQVSVNYRLVFENSGAAIFAR